METNPERDIMIDPRWAAFEDGLGYECLFLNGMPAIEDGEEVVVITLKPTDLTRKRYNLRSGAELNEQGNIKRTVKKIDLIPLNMYDEANKKWIYVKTLNHEPTVLSQREEELKSKIKVVEKRARLLEADNIKLNEQLALARLNPGKWIKEGAEVHEHVMKGMSDLFKRKDEN